MNRLQTHLALAAVAFASAALGACADETSATDLNTDGPPMLEQVRMSEQTQTGGSRRVFAFGTHPEAVDADGNPDPEQEHAVTSATAQSNQMRLIIDELLVGNSLEEIECRGQVDTDAYDRVPEGATPDDVAKCSAQKDVLPHSCVGEHAMCICHLPGGCTDTDGNMVAENQPLGVLDENEDGAADDTRFVNGAAGFKCGANGEIDVPVDLQGSYYNPSGNQNVPAVGGFDALGPAVVLIAAGALPTSQQCQVYFAPDVTDKQNNRICAPPNGDVTQDCVGGNDSGDTSAFKFSVQPIALTLQSFIEGGTDISRTDPITIVSNVPLADDAASKVTITTTTGGVAFTNFTASLMNMNRAIFLMPNGTGFAAQTAYTITLPTTIKDASGSPLPAPVTFHFTTGN